MRRHRLILDRHFYGSQIIDLSTFEMNVRLYTLHPNRKMLQLLQQSLRLSPTVNALWLCYAKAETIRHWYQVAAVDAHDFAAILCIIHTQYHDARVFLNGNHWTIRRPWQHALRHTFKLDTVIGRPPTATTARRVAAMVPAEALLRCTANLEWTFSSPDVCRCLWLLQPGTQPGLLEVLRCRVQRRKLHISVVILCPDTHPYALMLRQWHTANPVQCSIIFEGQVNTLPLILDQTHEKTESARQPLTAYWVTDAADPLVSTSDVVSHMGNHVRSGTGSFSPPMPGKFVPSQQHDLRKVLWQRWTTLTDEGRPAIRWPQHRWVTHLNAITALLAIAPCTCGTPVAKWKCEVGAHLGLSCALRCFCACLLCCLHAR